MYFTFIEQVRARLAESDVPIPAAQAYLQVLTNLNALSVLMAPDSDDDLNSSELAHLTRLFAQHQRRRVQMEEEHPLLAVLSRPAGWQGN
ncbi:hypothetical protein E5F05_07260 [Deinococcus metallilatus]|uniref:Uncharacterized protein n=1 Tax=Deinococcus metallilatus TaxID=1211322 RepID=A0AAJ5F5W4_9DEIO|nr:hypothetical protein [Deinococcus metallilatus]MBB5297075.1 hypothetical protein [Deinococcus metallilatus]QBY07768.1 hypothetical protein E5F05_07260 [Deinococcus metallilatus]RXJ13468.1 hypothetical protein ERJ73_06095 [Deinococcus metallilatus]TLK22375.1 hypothetical protein FCS05_17905 [Deinococcus metallilatus]GMA17326.1 hypothetical protein GCM10025871_36570 [Deinococcus metallilatus]